MIQFRNMLKWLSDLKPVGSLTEVYGREDRQAMAEGQMRDPEIQISEFSEMLECLTPTDLNWS